MPTSTQQGLTLSVTGMRVHELALQRWLNKIFIATEGYPIPVVFASPMDAFAQFNTLYGKLDGPYGYLHSVKDANGNLIGADNLRYPLISVKRASWDYDASRSFGKQTWRKVAYPVVQKDDLAINDLGNVVQTRRPVAYNYTFEISHVSMTPYAQGMFNSRLVRALSLSGGEPQAWIPVAYPGYVGVQHRRLFMSGNIRNMSEDPSQTEVTEYRSGVSLVLEGLEPSYTYDVIPTLWYELVGQSAVSPAAIDAAYDFNTDPQSIDLRTQPTSQ